MIKKEYEYAGHRIEIHEHPIYHDFEFVIKTLDNNVVKASRHPYDNFDDVQNSAELTINLYNNERSN